MSNIILDTCFWRAIYDSKDAHYLKAQSIAAKFIDNIAYKILVPYPTMYELLRIEFVKNKAILSSVGTLLNKECFEKICDVKYRDKALELTFSNNKRNLSVVDNLIRLMLEDTNLRINGIVTFNVGDFNDVCRNKSITLIDNPYY